MKCRTAVLKIQKLKTHYKCTYPRGSQIDCSWDGKTSHLDYASVLYYGLPENSIKKLQRGSEHGCEGYTRKEKIR